jgi:hypothetical protein
MRVTAFAVVGGQSIDRQTTGKTGRPNPNYRHISNDDYPEQYKMLGMNCSGADL